MDSFPLALRDIVQNLQAAAGAAAGRVWHAPRWVELEMVPVCNLRCTHCSVWQRRRSARALSLPEWMRVVDEIADFAGPAFLMITVGEPFLDPAVLDVVGAAARRGMRPYLVTNATLIDAELAARIKDSGLHSLYVSLDGFRPETHDSSRGVPGTHARVLEALRLLKAAGVAPVSLLTIVAEHNLAELPLLARWAREEGLHGIQFQPLQKYGDDWRSLWPRDPSRARAVLEELAGMRGAGAPIFNEDGHFSAMARYYGDSEAHYPEFLCRSGSTFIVLNEGDVLLCRYKDPVGNVRGSSVREIWKSQLVSARVAETNSCKKPCILNGCHFPESLGLKLKDLAAGRPA